MPTGSQREKSKRLGKHIEAEAQGQIARIHMDDPDRKFKIYKAKQSVIQSLRQINSAFRNNLSGVMLFAGISNRLEVNKIIEEYLGRFSQKEARQILKHAFKNPFDFLYVNLQNRGSLYRNFNLLNIQSQEQDD